MKKKTPRHAHSYDMKHGVPETVCKFCGRAPKNKNRWPFVPVKAKAVVS